MWGRAAFAMPYPLAQENGSIACNKHATVKLQDFGLRRKKGIHLREERGRLLRLNSLHAGGTCTQQKDQAEERHCPCKHLLQGTWRE